MTWRAFVLCTLGACIAVVIADAGLEAALWASQR